MADPATINGERCLLSAPEHDWERSVAAVNEGPEVLRNPARDKLFVAYSAGARHVVYHRKLSADPGWADREIRVLRFDWDPDGYPLIAA